jgi:hypothetical protein
VLAESRCPQAIYIAERLCSAWMSSFCSGEAPSSDKRGGFLLRGFALRFHKILEVPGLRALELERKGSWLLGF